MKSIRYMYSLTNRSPGAKGDQKLFQLHRPGAEVGSGPACRAENPPGQPGGFDTPCSFATAGTERRLKAMSQWGLQHRTSSCGEINAVAAPACTWQTPSEAAALLEALAMQSS